MNLRKEIEKLEDKDYKKFNKNICKDTSYEMLGVRVPQLRTLAKEIVIRDDWQNYVSCKDVKYFEEIFVKGLIIAYLKMDFLEKEKYIREYISYIDSWALTDSFCPTLKIKQDELEEVWNFIGLFLNSEREFEVRFSVIMMLNYFIIDEYVDKVIERLNKINHEGYYVKMGAAWCLAEIGIKYNDKLMNFLKNKNDLDNFTYNKTLQKMIESYRITREQKEELRMMKRK